MKKFLVLFVSVLALLSLTACGTMSHAAPVDHPATVAQAGAGELTTTPTTVHLEPQASAAAVDATPDVPEEVKAIDPITRVITSPTVVEHLNRSLAIASPDDKIFRQCVQTTLDVGADLKASPLVTIPNVNLSEADPSCPACVLAAKRKIQEQLLSGQFAVKVAEVRARARAIQQKIVIGCAPLFADEKLTLANFAAAFGLKLK